MKEIFSYTKLFTVLIAIFYIFGLIAQFYNFKIIFAILIFIILGIFILFFNLNSKKAIILLLMFFLGIIRADHSQNIPYILDNIESDNAIIEGQIISSKTNINKKDKTNFYLRANFAKIDDKEYKNLNTKFLISADSFNLTIQKLDIGDYLILKGSIKSPKPATNPHQFDYQQYLLNNDIKNILYPDEIKIIKTPNFSKNFKDNWYLILKKFNKIRNNIIQAHSKNIQSPKLEVLGGIVFGNETINPDEQIKESFKNSGLLHLLAASGLNVALIYGILWWIANLLRFPYHLSIFTGAIFVIFYTFMTGFPPSILRASAMLLFILFGKLIDRNANSLALIFFVGFLMLLFNPKMLFDVGFQLSFVVTIGLIICCPVIISKFENQEKAHKEKYKNASRIKKYFSLLISPYTLTSIISVPLVAQLFVIPLQMHYFNNFAPLSLLANIAVIPFIGILSFIGFLSSIFALIPILNKSITYLFDFMANPLLDLLIEISNFFSSFKFSLISTTGLNVWQIFIFWAILLILILNIKNNFKNKKEIYCLIFSTLLFFITFMHYDKYQNNLKITMFDVGNADCFLIKTPKNRYIMIDTGKISFKGSTSAQMIINKYLKNENIKNIEKIIITHFDSDHCAGLIEILKNTKTKEIIIQNEIAKSKISKEILDYLKNNNLDYKIAKNNEEIYKEDKLSIKTYLPNGTNSNETSIVVLLTQDKNSILFMADTNAKNFKSFEKYINKEIDAIKIGHHGAKNSIDNNMLQKLKPKYAMISAGDNKFNHPHYSTINLLNENNIKTITTKHFGFTELIFDKKEILIYHFDSKNKKLKKLFFPDLKGDLIKIENYINNL